MMLHRNLRRDTSPGSTNKYTKFGQLIIRKIIKIVTRCHILRLKCTKFDSQRLSICPSIRLCLRWSFTLKFHHCFALDVQQHIHIAYSDGWRVWSAPCDLTTVPF